MVGDARAELESRLRAAHAEGDMASAATMALREYGPEILGLLLAMLRDSEQAAEVYAQFSADFWAALPRFRWESSLRTWAYVLARNAVHAVRRDPHARRRAALSDHPEVEDIVARARTTTLTFLRSETRDRVMRLRESLSPDEQMLLILRIDRQMAWNDIALVMGHTTGPDGMARVVVALRKRFERVKERLRALAMTGERLRGAHHP
jgi:RNA polymerase sigma-70 factor (ECF subfamily)